MRVPKHQLQRGPTRSNPVQPGPARSNPVRYSPQKPENRARTADERKSSARQGSPISDKREEGEEGRARVRGNARAREGGLFDTDPDVYSSTNAFLRCC
uniref:Uncharacterized protein n=1 Tax=Knipowitschia caucasica TaxID=637954 RepID=A0AAV2J826_KNICA